MENAHDKDGACQKRGSYEFLVEKPVYLTLFSKEDRKLNTPIDIVVV